MLEEEELDDETVQARVDTSFARIYDDSSRVTFTSGMKRIASCCSPYWGVVPVLRIVTICFSFETCCEIDEYQRDAVHRHWKVTHVANTRRTLADD